MAFDFGNIGIATEKTVADAAAAKKKNGLGLTQEDFFKLLTQQMKVQDPSKTQDASKILDQMSQMTSIQSMQDMTDSFSSMMEAMSAGQAMQASSLIGRSVMVPGESGNLLPGDEVKGQIVLPDSTSMLKVTVTDNIGNVVDVINMGEHDSGKANFNWDGTMLDGSQAPPGVYSFKAEAVVDGKAVTQELRMPAEVASVNVDESGVALNLLDGRQVSMKDVNEIF